MLSVNKSCKRGKLGRRSIKILSRANNYNSSTKQGNSASGIPWIRLNSSALYGFSLLFNSVKGGVKIGESLPQICWFFGVHLKGDVTMSFAATLHPKIIKVV